MSLGFGLDLLLVVGLVGVAYLAIHASDLFTGVVLYVGFGLLLAIVWVRLEAPDLALAEAAIGAGLTGAMLLDAAAQMGSAPDRQAERSGIARLLSALALTGFAATLALVVTSGASGFPSLQAEVVARLPDSGVDHPVTAVLLNYRAYDTWLEVGVLLTAAIVLFALRADDSEATSTEDAVGEDEVVAGSVSLLIPTAVLVAGYLLWKGTHGPGGAFQAGAVLGALLLLVALLRGAGLRVPRTLAARFLLVAGFSVFAAAGLLGPLSGGAFLEYRGPAAGVIILLIETAVAASIAATLVFLVVAGRHDPARGEG